MQFLVNIGLDDNGGSLDREQNFAMIAGRALPRLVTTNPITIAHMRSAARVGASSPAASIRRPL